MREFFKIIIIFLQNIINQEIMCLKCSNRAKCRLFQYLKNNEGEKFKHYNTMKLENLFSNIHLPRFIKKLIFK